MQLYGIHFIYKPTIPDPIISAQATLQGQVLTLDSFTSWRSLPSFDFFLRNGSGWVGGIAVPLGLKVEFIHTHLEKKPSTWVELVEEVGKYSLRELTHIAEQYKLKALDVAFQRQTDQLRHINYPFMPPALANFHAASLRLLWSKINLPRSNPTTNPRTMLEVQPALVLRKLGLENFKYQGKDPAATQARTTILQEIKTHCLTHYGFKFKIQDLIANQPINDFSGSTLEALLAVIPAAWGALQPHYAIPPTSNPLEGWIVDPAPRAVEIKSG